MQSPGKRVGKHVQKEGCPKIRETTKRLLKDAAIKFLPVLNERMINADP
jgi:hypothetical protein